MKLLLGVTGGIAVYKACDLVRRFRERDHEVQVVMTSAAQRFVSPMTFSVLSGRKVGTALFDEAAPEIDHIELARWPDLILIAPATAHSLARFALGMADDLLSTIVLASEPSVPLVLAPAMNTVMWENPAVRRNLGLLTETGRVSVVAPAVKQLACGESGAGALADEAEIMAAVDSAARA